MCLCGQCLEDSSSHCPFLVECFGGWGKGEPGEAQAGGGASRGGGIMHQVHTSESKHNISLSTKARPIITQK